MKNTNETPLLNNMRESRKIANAAFINFTDNYNFFENHVFCFYEGEDGKYYNQRIKSLLGNSIIPIKAKNKANTIKVWRKIKQDSEYDHVKKMFFIDRDMDDLPEDIDGDLYTTPCYSIENFYCNINCFKNIIESEFSINCTEGDYVKCTDLFESLLNSFCREMILFNALVLIRNKKRLNDRKVSLKINTRQVISITLDEVKQGDKYHVITELQKELAATKNEVNNAIEHLKNTGDFTNNFRGKNQLDFMVEFLKLLKIKKDDLSFFTIKRESITLNLSGNRLSELSQYASTPDCLNEFILNHKL